MVSAVVVVVVTGFHFQVLQFALRKQVGGSQFDVGGVLQVRGVNNLDGFEIFHVLYRDWKEDRAGVAGHRRYTDHSPLRGHTFDGFRVDFSLRVENLNVGDLDGFLRLGLHY